MSQCFTWKQTHIKVDRRHTSAEAAAATVLVCMWSCDACISDTHTQQYGTDSVSQLPLSPLLNASLSVWRTVRGPRYYQTWEMVHSAAVTAGCLPAQRRTACPTNHRVSIHGALSSTLTPAVLSLSLRCPGPCWSWLAPAVTVTNIATGCERVQ